MLTGPPDAPTREPSTGASSWSWFAVELAYFGAWLTCSTFGVVAWFFGGFALGVALIASNEDPLALRLVWFLGWVGLGGPLLIGLLLWIGHMWSRPHGRDAWELGRAALLTLPLLPFAALASIPFSLSKLDWPWLAIPPGLAVFGTLALLSYLTLLGLRVVWAPNRAVQLAEHVDP